MKTVKFLVAFNTSLPDSNGNIFTYPVLTEIAENLEDIPVYFGFGDLPIGIVQAGRLVREGLPEESLELDVELGENRYETQFLNADFPNVNLATSIRIDEFNQKDGVREITGATLMSVFINPLRGNPQVSIGCSSVPEE